MRSSTRKKTADDQNQSEHYTANDEDVAEGDSVVHQILLTGTILPPRFTSTA